MLRQLAHKGQHLRRRIGGAGRIVRDGKKNEFGFLRDRAFQTGQIVPVIDERHFDRPGAEQQRDQLVHDKCRTAHHRLVAGIEKNVAEQFEDFVGTVADNELIGAEPVTARELLAQREAAAVRIKLALLERALRRRHRTRRRAEGIFVGRELDDARRVEPKLARDLFDRLAGFINRLSQR